MCRVSEGRVAIQVSYELVPRAAAALGVRASMERGTKYSLPMYFSFSLRGSDLTTDVCEGVKHITAAMQTRAAIETTSIGR